MITDEENISMVSRIIKLKSQLGYGYLEAAKRVF
jgi:hypothetical protein